MLNANAGCWQLSGGHKGERESDRTAGKQAVEVGNPCQKMDTAGFAAPDESMCSDTHLPVHLIVVKGGWSPVSP
jgi:hypothetical protein